MTFSRPDRISNARHRCGLIRYFKIIDTGIDSDGTRIVQSFRLTWLGQFAGVFLSYGLTVQ